MSISRECQRKAKENTFNWNHSKRRRKKPLSSPHIMSASIAWLYIPSHLHIQMHRITIIIKHCIFIHKIIVGGQALTPTTQQQRIEKQISSIQFISVGSNKQKYKNIFSTKRNGQTEHLHTKSPKHDGSRIQEKATKNECWSEMLAVCESRTQWARHKRWKKGKINKYL